MGEGGLRTAFLATAAPIFSRRSFKGCNMSHAWISSHTNVRSPETPFFQLGVPMSRIFPLAALLGCAVASGFAIGTTQPADAARCSPSKRFVQAYGCVPKTVYADAKKLCRKFKEPASWCIVSNDPGQFVARRITD
jgi:hypothetical protein